MVLNSHIYSLILLIVTPKLSDYQDWIIDSFGSWIETFQNVEMVYLLLSLTLMFFMPLVAEQFRKRANDYFLD